MNSQTDEDGATGSVEQQQDEAAADALTAFAGDKSQLRLDTRRVLVQLLLGPSVDARRQSKLWPVLLREESILRSRLNELFLELVIDHDQQVAFTRQAQSEEIEVPILLRKAHLTFIDSALLIYLRQRLTQADTAGDRAVVSLEDMLEHLSIFERQSNSNRAQFDKQKQNAVEKAKTLSLLRSLPGSEKRFEVAPTLKLLFPAEQIAALTAVYRGLETASDPGGVSSTYSEQETGDE